MTFEETMSMMREDFGNPEVLATCYKCGSKYGPLEWNITRMCLSCLEKIESDKSFTMPLSEAGWAELRTKTLRGKLSEQ